MKRYPRVEDLLRPLRRFMTETVWAFHRARGRRGHFWERRHCARAVETTPRRPPLPGPEPGPGGPGRGSRHLSPPSDGLFGPDASYRFSDGNHISVVRQA